MRITSLERRHGSKRVKLCLDEDVEMVVSLEVCLQRGLRVGDHVTRTQIDELNEAEARRRCLDSALRLLSYRQRSEAELRERLVRKQAQAEVVFDTIERLRRTGLLDDAQFARSWVEGRNGRAPRSRRLIAAELRGRGVSRRVVEEAVARIDDTEAAYRTALRRAHSLSALPYAQFRQRIGGLLLRRGFGFEIVRQTVARLWAEQTTPPCETEHETDGS